MTAPIETVCHGGFRPNWLYSLWEIMQRFRAASFANATSALMRAAANTLAASAAGLSVDPEIERQYVRHELNQAEPSLKELPLSIVVRSQFDRLKNLIDQIDAAEIAVLIREFHNNLIVELTSSWFLMIRAEKREFYEQRQSPFGDKVAGTFDAANKDIAAASRCYALDEWTACIFHLMRVLEHGLRVIADVVGLSANIMAHENWKNVIDQIEKKIREMGNEPKSPEKIKRLQFLSSAASQFRYFKDAWRNHVSHSHANYDEREAERVWIHVKTFMEQMAEASSREQPS